MDSDASEDEHDKYDIENIEQLEIPDREEGAIEFVPSTSDRLIIDSIEITNFKSYGGVRWLGPFHKRFSCIIGPNGSGKSNVIDAMLFVFGYRAQRIRTKKLANLIHSSDLENLPDICSVRIHFKRIKDDENSPEDYITIPDSKFSLGREAHRTGSSAYFIDDKHVNFEAIKRKLLVNGVDLNSSRFLILQGEVEQISVMKAKSQREGETGLLEFLEGIIGTRRYNVPLELLTKKIDVLSEVKLERHNRVRAAAVDLNLIKKKRDEAVAFLEFENEVIRKEYVLTKYQLRRDNAEHDEANSKYDAAKAELQKLEEFFAELHKKRDAEKAALMKSDRAIANSTRTLEKTNHDLGEIDKTLVLEKQTCSRDKKSIADLTKTIEMDKNKLRKLEETVVTEPGNDKKAAIEQLEEVIKETEKELASAEEEAWKQTKAEREKIDRIRKEMLVHSKTRNKAKAQLDLATSDYNFLMANKDGSKNELETVKQEHKQLLEIVEKLKSDLNEEQKETGGLNQKLNAANSNAAMAEQAEREGRVRYQKAQSELSVINERNNNVSTRSRLMNFLNEQMQIGTLTGVFGRMGDLASVESRYDVAVSTAGGRYLDYIVVDTMDTAQRCVELLKQHRMGVASFVGLEKQQHWLQNVRKPFQNPYGSTRIFDVLKVHQECLKPVFYYAFRDTLITETLDQATRVAYGEKRYRVVTLLGQIIEMSGTLSGGGRPVKGKMLLSSGQSMSVVRQEDIQKLGRNCKELEKLVCDTNEKCIQAKKMAHELHEEMMKLTRHIQEITTSLHQYSAKLKGTESRLSRAEGKAKEMVVDPKQIVAAQKQVEKCQQEYEKVGSRYDKMEEDCRELRKSIDSATEAITSSYKANLQIKQDKLSDLNNEVAEMQNSLKALERSKVKLQTKIDKAKNREIELEQSIASSTYKIESMTKESEKLLEKQNELQKLVEKMKSDRDLVAENLKQIESEIRENQKGNIDLRDMVARLGAFAHKLMIMIKSVEARLNDLKLNTIYEGYCLVSLEDTTIPNEMNIESAKREIEAGKKKVESDNPELNAIRLYREKEVAYQERLDDLREILDKLKITLLKQEEFRKRRHDEFVAGFQLIGAYVKTIYRAITFGGDAELELVDSLDPFAEGVEFSVRPPDKSWKKISNVSGGEKTLSSLALIFALHLYKPTSLYFMDEIDAALDYRNVSVVAHFIKERTKDAQFVVISLRPDMVEMADNLCGIYKSQNISSAVAIFARAFMDLLYARFDGLYAKRNLTNGIIADDIDSTYVTNADESIRTITNDGNGFHLMNEDKTYHVANGGEKSHALDRNYTEFHQLPVQHYEDVEMAD